MFTLLGAGKCTCKELISPFGSGNCLQTSIRLNNKPYCYVDLPSSCPDLLDSSDIPGEKYSADACSNTGICRITQLF